MTDHGQFGVTNKQNIAVGSNTHAQTDLNDRSGSFSAGGTELNVSLGQSHASMPALSTTLPRDDNLFFNDNQQSISMEYDLDAQDRLIPTNAANDVPPPKRPEVKQKQPKPVPRIGNKDAGGDNDDGLSPSVDEHESIAPDALTKRVADLRQVDGERQSVWKRASAAAGLGAVIGGGIGAIVGVGILSLPLAAAGAIGGAIVGAVVGIGVSTYRARMHNKELEQAQQTHQRDLQNLTEQNNHFDQAIANLRKVPKDIGAAQIKSLNKITSEQWSQLLGLDHVEDETDRLNIRQALIAHIMSGGDAESAAEYKGKLENALRINTLDFMLGAQSLIGKSPKHINKFMKDFAHVIGSKELWSAKGVDEFTGQPNDLKVIATSVPHQFGGHMMLGAMRRLQDPAYKLTEHDKWQINQALSPESSDDWGIPEVISDDQVGKTMTYEQKTRLADKMKDVYVNKFNLMDDDKSELIQTYSNAHTLNKKLDLLESSLERGTDYTKHSVIRAMQRAAAGVDLSNMDRDVTRPNPSSENEQKQQALFSKFRAGVSEAIGPEHKGRNGFANAISSLQDESPSSEYDQSRIGHANVSRFFFRDANRMPMTLKSNGDSVNLLEKTKQKDAGDEDLKNWDAGDELRDFCDGDADVAKNLSRFAHQGILRPMMEVIQQATSRDDGMPAIGFSADDTDSATTIQIEKDRNGDFIMTAQDDKGLASISPPPAGTRARPIDPFHNRCVSQIRIRFKNEDLKQGNGKFEFVEPPTFETRMDPDRGGFENTRALHHAEALNDNEISVPDQNHGIMTFMHKHRQVMANDKFWQAGIQDNNPARQNADVFGAGLALALAHKASDQDTLDEDAVRDLKKALNPFDDAGSDAGGVDASRLDALSDGTMDDDMESRLADLIYQQYVPENASGGQADRPQLNLSGDALNQLNSVFDNQDSTGADKLQALDAALFSVVEQRGTELAPALETIFKTWPNPGP